MRRRRSDEHLFCRFPVDIPEVHDPLGDPFKIGIVVYAAVRYAS
jgi:hypothetical protein